MSMGTTVITAMVRLGAEPVSEGALTAGCDATMAV